MKTGVALVGYGYWGKKVFRYLVEDPEIDTRSVCFRSFDKNTFRVDPDFPSSCVLTSSYEDVLRDEMVEMVFLATPVNTHFEMTKQALLAGKHVMVEKPLSESTEECEEIETLARTKKLRVLTDYTYTFSGALRNAAAAVEAGKIGRIERVEISIHQLGRFNAYDVFTLLGSHSLSMLDMFVPLKTLEFFGRPLLWNNTGSARLVTAGEMEFKNRDITGRISLSLHSPVREKKLVIYGDQGTITYDPLKKQNLSIVTYSRKVGALANELVTSEEVGSFDENDNLRFAVAEIPRVMSGHVQDNLERSVGVTRVLNVVKKSAYVGSDYGA